MSASWGTKVRYTLFGESHGTAIGIIIDGLPAGIEIDWDFIQSEMARRAPGGELSTRRQEPDQVEIQSGIYNNKTTGAPLAARIVNQNQRSSDYGNLAQSFRPSHGDYGGWVKFDGFNDPRGGGPFSGRLTAPIVFAGAIIKKLLEREEITIGAHLEQIGKVTERRFDSADNKKTLASLTQSAFPLLQPKREESMKGEIITVRDIGDSVGGVIEAMALGIPAGKGDLFFGSVESRLSQLLFSIPAVKGLEFGSGFGLTSMRGSEANDPWIINDKQVQTQSNHTGGILGGLTTGMPLICRVAVKPTSSIFLPQQTVNTKLEPCELLIQGRHDPCIVPRALPVVEAMMALAIWDIL